MDEMKLELRLQAKEPSESDYDVFDLKGIKLDYFDIELAKQAVSTEILTYQKLIEKNPSMENKKYNGRLHLLEEKLGIILSKMEYPETDMRPAGFYLTS